MDFPQHRHVFLSRRMGPALLALSLTLMGCNLSGGTDPGKKDPKPPHPGMKLVRAKGASFNQGGAGPMAAPSETPVIRNSFTYDYWMDATEVTQSEFAALMGWSPVPPNTPYGLGNRHPVYDATWFDAALFCNARSRKAGLDTVYAYARAEKASSGSAYGLVGLVIRHDRPGFRLPTEAEWEYAANAGSTGAFPWGDSPDEAKASEVAWYEGNAGNTSHPVAGLASNSFGIHDLAGNVMEWVNDWKGSYPAVGMEDFAGARDPGPQGEKPVKGGAYPYGIRYLRPAGRAATYSTTPSARAPYVGFRCVQGAIGKPRYTSAAGQPVETDPVTLASPYLPKAFGGRRAKLAFINASESQRSLAFVDFGQFPPRVHEFLDGLDAHYPALSPDGNWVAYGTAPEGAESGSELFIRRLDAAASEIVPLGPGFIPRWWVDESVRDTFLVYASTGMTNLEERWTTGKTWLLKIAAGRPVGAPQALVEDGGFHDGRSRGGRWLATGYQLLRVRDLEAKETRVLFTAPENGKAAGDTSQVCNVSIAPDSSGRTLFLDFGYPARSALTGMAYGIHQFAFMADPRGKVLRWYQVPPGEESWDEMEWSNHPRFAASSARDAGDRHRNLYLLDLEDSAATPLASGTRLLQPSLWVDPVPGPVIAGGLDPDSMGIYNDPPANYMQAFFADKLKKLWKHRLEWEVVALGSSHAHYGIDPSRMSRPTFNFGYMANGWMGSRVLARDYVLNLCPKVKAVVVEIFAMNLVHPDGDLSFNQTIALTKGYNYDRSNGFWKDGVPAQAEGLVQMAPNPLVLDVDSVGWTAGTIGTGWGSNPPPAHGYAEWTTDHPEYRKNLADIQALARTFSDRKIHIWFVNYPVSPHFRQTLRFQTYGPSWETGRAVMRDIRELEAISPYVHFYDAYQDGNHDYTDSEALDWDHLNDLGAAKLTRRLDSLLTILP